MEGKQNRTQCRKVKSALLTPYLNQIEGMQSSLASILGPIVAVYLLSFYPDKNNDWTVSKMEWEDFEFNTWLPGRYSTIVTNAGLAAFNESKCSTKHVNCSYSFDSKNYTRIKLWGTMSPDLMWATFKGDGNLVPVTVYFFNNKTWGNIDHKMLQPQFSLPLVITASGQEIVTFTCVFTNYIGAEVNIYFGDKMRLVYNSTVNAISNYSQILNVEAKRMTIFERYTLTVKKVNEIDYYTCSVNGQYLTHAIIWSIICTFAGAEEPPMFPNDGRIVYGKLGSTFNYKTVLPGMYNRVASGMHDVIIMKKDCSTPLFKCNIEKEMPHRSVVTLTGTMNYGLKRATFFGNNSIPITVLFYTDHYWPEIDDHTFQWQYSLPLVTYAKDSDIVTISVYILHVSVISLPNFTLTYSASNTPVYREMGYNHLKNYSHILNLEKSVFAMHTIIALTVKKKEYVDYYCFEYNGQHHTHTIVWGKPSPIPKPDVINDFLSLLPMEEVISHFRISQSHQPSEFAGIDGCRSVCQHGVTRLSWKSGCAVAIAMSDTYILPLEHEYNKSAAEEPMEGKQNRTQCRKVKSALLTPYLNQIEGMQSLASILGPIVAVYLLSFYPDKNNDWTVSKMEWEDFEFNTWLPGRYSTIVTNAGLAAFNESKCSTKHVNCSYSFGEVVQINTKPLSRIYSFIAVNV
ncbi:hypothetical protein TcWFU_009082 [Taenia crassiceps]|uniref:Uncharacterized protein n=1 Tax=Taenia crassiceps TaxID=6207 RepID=A0ABR4Q9V7_9CEST